MDFYSQCQQIKTNVKSQPNAYLKWSNYTVHDITSLDKIRFDGFDIPIVVTENMEESAFLFGENPELVITSVEDNEDFKSQIVMLNSNLSESFNTAQPSIVQGSIFEILKKSLDITPSDFVCDREQIGGIDKNTLKSIVEKYILISLKSIAAPYGFTCAIRLKGRDAFIIRSKTGVEYYEVRNGKALKIIVETNEVADLDKFIYTLESTSEYKEYSKVTYFILKAIKSKKSKIGKLFLK
ncbi:hypothetical protein L1077_23900 [Pseudoalteromonas luteoviolacea]|uniref:hypothetical protein n=1 Tax=Pseudoalteromonas luteoviolacea TaxID=43657 RepID=UPI001F173F1D|nr:hypothetical protein [Pseudoalteromonas luteoviolacea]MCF6442477.1 hypothetical protein [Pseudoalteromonas luteoviolacea]